MNICIIGGGFYGCMLAILLKEKSPNINIDLYEENSDILKEAIRNNQQRLHLGYHYPRCEYTVDQCIRSYHSFLKYFEKYTKTVKSNLYVVHRDGHVSFEDYIKLYRKKNLNFKEINSSELSSYKMLKNIEQFSGAVLCEEKVLLLGPLIEKTKKEMKNKNINVFVDNEIIKVDNNSMVHSHNFNKKYDFVINTTYTNPDLGLNDESIQTKSELCFIPLYRDLEDTMTMSDTCITIMDGPYCSLYQTDAPGVLSLSNVVTTPYYKSKDPNKLKNIKRNLSNDEVSKISKKIVDSSLPFLSDKIKDMQQVGCYISLKTKLLDDKNDFRGYYIRENNNISLMCGKISAIFDMKDSIIKEIFCE